MSATCELIDGKKLTHKITNNIVAQYTLIESIAQLNGWNFSLSLSFVSLSFGDALLFSLAYF